MKIKSLVAFVVMIVLLTTSCKTASPLGDSIEKQFYIVAHNNAGTLNKIELACQCAQVCEMQIINSIEEEKHGLLQLNGSAPPVLVIRLKLSAINEEKIAQAKNAVGHLPEVIGLSVY